MTDRYKGFIVTLDKDIRSDDAEATINALRCIRGVISVEPMVATLDDHMARQRMRHEWQATIHRVLAALAGNSKITIEGEPQ